MKPNTVSPNIMIFPGNIPSCPDNRTLNNIEHCFERIKPSFSKLISYPGWNATSCPARWNWSKRDLRNPSLKQPKDLQGDAWDTRKFDKIMSCVNVSMWMLRWVCCFFLSWTFPSCGLVINPHESSDCINEWQILGNIWVFQSTV